MPACGHASNVDARIDTQRLHANAVAQNGAACERAARIDGDDSDGIVFFAKFGCEAIHKRALAGTRTSRYADDLRLARVRK